MCGKAGLKSLVDKVDSVVRDIVYDAYSKGYEDGFLSKQKITIVKDLATLYKDKYKGSENIEEFLQWCEMQMKDK